MVVKLVTGQLEKVCSSLVVFCYFSVLISMQKINLFTYQQGMNHQVAPATADGAVEQNTKQHLLVVVELQIR